MRMNARRESWLKRLPALFEMSAPDPERARRRGNLKQGRQALQPGLAAGVHAHEERKMKNENCARDGRPFCIFNF